ncbi:MAG: TetR/AcrR family transcriptional regulator [Anaerolineaceae bacterium]|nr:TetR/AcrR family transcriptional regulator [Anaerolineaceae bacterium]
MKQKEISSATQKTILDAASKVILDKGAQAFTLDAVSREANISKGGLLYHFPLKKQLIEGMIERLIAEVDSSLKEELAKSGGDYLAAYIRASFQTNPERDKVSCALFAAIANDPKLLEPLRARFFKMQSEIAAAAVSPEIGTLIRLALDGLWVSDLFDFAPPQHELREKILSALLVIAQCED